MVSVVCDHVHCSVLFCPVMFNRKGKSWDNFAAKFNCKCDVIVPDQYHIHLFSLWITLLLILSSWLAVILFYCAFLLHSYSSISVWSAVSVLERFRIFRIVASHTRVIFWMKVIRFCTIWKWFMEFCGHHSSFYFSLPFSFLRLKYEWLRFQLQSWYIYGGNFSVNQSVDLFMNFNLIVKIKRNFIWVIHS